MVRQGKHSVSRKLMALRHDELMVLRCELYDVKERLDSAYRGFNSNREPELIEASIYEINALGAKYSWILSRIKSKTAEPVERFSYPKLSALGELPAEELL